MFTLPIEVSPQPSPELSAKGLDILYKTHTHCKVQQQELGILVVGLTSLSSLEIGLRLSKV